VDDRPFGGGEGMVLKPQPLAEGLASLGVLPKAEREAETSPENPPPRTRVILLSAQGTPFTQAVARELATVDRVILLCGRYEGVDERINQLYCDMELSIGDYVLSGGELAAAVIVDATMRLLPGVLGNEASSEFESFGVADAPTCLKKPPSAARTADCWRRFGEKKPNRARPSKEETAPAYLNGFTGAG
jgi:tRNA (guanine37-N1)-methyltransferase